VKRAALLVLAAACGDNGELHDPVLTGECTVTFAGNFSETSIAPDNCASLRQPSAPGGETLLRFGIPSMVLGDTLGITIDLGDAPLPGRYTSTTIAPWSAFGLRQIGAGGCVYNAGDTAVPPGSFTLDLAELAADTAHGTLAIEQYVLAIQGTDCGAGSTESVTIEF
jgi:hypothetical protein